MIGGESVDGEGIVTTVPTEETVEQPKVQRQLRLALAMRGGVSLAVWMGGAVSEIERLRRTSSDTVYGRLLEANGYDDVLVDVLSGASAGGLNGVVLAAAQVYDFPIATLRDIWLQLGDLELLARGITAGERAKSAACVNRPISRNEAQRPLSLLRGDEYFYEQLKQVLASRTKTCDATVRLELLLSATLFRPERVKRPVNATTVIEDGRSNALFRFRHTHGDDSSFLGAEAPARLAMAGRSTSSFPAAFEPASIAVGPAAAENAVDKLDFVGTFELPAVSTADGTYEVIDGGVLDNIPVAAAIDAIVDAEADGPTDRWLCYLHPSPSSADASELEPVGARPPRRARGLATTLRTFATRSNQESVLEDIDELGLVNDAIARRRMLRDTLLAPFGTAGRDDLLDHVADPATLERLHAVLAQLEAHRVRSNLERPDKVGLDPLPVPVTRWSAAAQVALGHTLVRATATRIERNDETPSLLAASEAIDLLIAFARAIESTGLEQNQERASVVKSRLYQLRARHDQLVAEEAAIVNRRVAEEALDNTSGAVALESLEPAVEVALAEAATTLGEGLRSLHQHLHSEAGKLADIDANVPAPFALLQPRQAERSTRDARDEQVGRTGRILDALVLTLLPVRLVGRGPWGEISFVHITGDAPVADPFPKLQDDDGNVGAKEKLCGNELANFAAFLSAKWRANDWMWGRMDTASTFVSALTRERVLNDDSTRERLTELAGLEPQAESEAIREAIRKKLQDEILAEELPVVAATPAGEIDRAAEDDAATLSSETLAVGNEGVSSLGATRRVRIGMRMAHLVFDAGRPGGESQLQTVVRLVLSLLKPLYLALVFVVVAPPLGVLAIAIGVAVLQSLFWSGADDFEATFDMLTWLFVGAVVASAAPAAVGAVLLRRDDSRGHRWRAGSLPILLVAFPAAVLAILRGHGLRYLTLAALALVLIAVAGYQLVTTGRGRIAIAWAMSVVVAIAGLIVGWIAPFAASTDRWDDVRALVLILLGAGLLVVVLANYWMRPTGLLLAIALTVTTGLGTLQLTEHADETVLGVGSAVWLWLSLALIALVYLGDLEQLRRYCDWPSRGDRLLTTILSATLWLSVLGAIGLATTLGHYQISIGAWSVVAVVAVSYAIAVLATFYPVFREPQRLQLAGPMSGRDL